MSATAAMVMYLLKILARLRGSDCLQASLLKVERPYDTAVSNGGGHPFGAYGSCEVEDRGIYRSGGTDSRPPSAGSHCSLVKSTKSTKSSPLVPCPQTTVTPPPSRWRLRPCRRVSSARRFDQTPDLASDKSAPRVLRVSACVCARVGCAWVGISGWA